MVQTDYKMNKIYYREVAGLRAFSCKLFPYYKRDFVWFDSGAKYLRTFIICTKYISFVLIDDFLRFQKSVNKTFFGEIESDRITIRLEVHKFCIFCTILPQP